jgi:hypothetical protein
VEQEAPGGGGDEPDDGQGRQFWLLGSFSLYVCSSLSLSYICVRGRWPCVPV